MITIIISKVQCVHEHFILFFGYLSLWVVVEWVPETRILGTCSSMEKWVVGKFNKAFLHFLPNFCHIIFDDISKVRRTEGAVAEL